MNRKHLIGLSLGLMMPILSIFLIDRSWQTALVLVVALVLIGFNFEMLRRDEIEVGKLQNELADLKAKVDGFTAYLSMRNAL